MTCQGHLTDVWDNQDSVKTLWFVGHVPSGPSSPSPPDGQDSGLVLPTPELRTKEMLLSFDLVE